MRKFLMILICSFLTLFLVAINAGATVIINSNGFSYGDSWDNPPDEIEDILLDLQSEIYGDGSGDIHLNIVNYGLDMLLETWTGFGLQSVIMEELAGYKNNTTFGWYNSGKDSTYADEIFSGSDSIGAEKTITFADETNFGFYIDPNGISNNRMYTEHSRNTQNDYQVVVFSILEADNQYIFGWEDLDLNGGSGSDRDYQDMIIRATINTNPVPEPATMLLFGSGLVGLAGFSRKFRKR